MEEVWVGGYNSAAEDSAGITSSLIVASIPDLEIGTWYSIAEYREKLGRAEWDTNEILTTVEIPETTTDSGKLVTLDIPQGYAAQAICESIAEHLAFGDNGTIWIRFE